MTLAKRGYHKVNKKVKLHLKSSYFSVIVDVPVQQLLRKPVTHKNRAKRRKAPNQLFKAGPSLIVVPLETHGNKILSLSFKIVNVI